jgi:F-type H+-transporting ATPase subunit a
MTEKAVSGIKILMDMPEISIKAEPIFKIGNFHVSNSLILSSVMFVFFLIVALLYNKQSKEKNKGKIFYFVNFALKAIYGLFESILKEKTTIFFPIFGAFFLFILLQNWIGLLPGVGSILIRVVEHGEAHYFPIFRGNNADLNATLALALISVFLIQFFGIKYLGFKGYIKKFINFSNPINFFVGILEVISEISKIISFSFRLFGNIFAGEVLLTIVAFLIPVAVSFPFIMLEIFVGLVQALVFSLLSAVFLNLAISSHH